MAPRPPYGPPTDELVTFPTPKEAFGRASQIQQQQQQRGSRKPPPGYQTQPAHNYVPGPSQPQQRQYTGSSGGPASNRSRHTSNNNYQQLTPQHTQRQTRVPPPPQQYQQQAPPPPQLQPQAPPSQDSEFQYAQSPPMELRQPNPIQPQPTSSAERMELRLRDLFNKVDRNRSGRLSEAELSLALFNNDKSQFQPSTVKLMIKLFDKDGSGTIDFREFYHLWNYIGHWRTVFGIYDKDKSNTITFSEYQETLKNFGYRLPTDTVLFVFQKFSSMGSSGGSGIYLKFDSYVESLIWLLRCTNSFKKYDTQETGLAVFPFDKYIQEILGFQ